MMMDLARHYGAGPESLAEIAKHEALPMAYLEQLVGGLRKAGLVNKPARRSRGIRVDAPPGSHIGW